MENIKQQITELERTIKNNNVSTTLLWNEMNELIKTYMENLPNYEKEMLIETILVENNIDIYE